MLCSGHRMYVHAIVPAMAQTKAGAELAAAKRLGITVEDYRRRVVTEKWCTGCKAWHPHVAFGRDASRFDGLASICMETRGTAARAHYVPKPRPKKGRTFVPARDGDKKQARRRVNYFVEAGLLPAPNTVPCVDCGHVWAVGERRHEYDHHLGYAAEHHEHVEALCSKCHHAREVLRAE